MLAGGPWGVIRAVTAGITQCLRYGATFPVGVVMEEGTGNSWEVLDPCQELQGPSKSQGDLGVSRRDRECWAARAIYLCTGEAPLIFGSLS